GASASDSSVSSEGETAAPLVAKGSARTSPGGGGGGGSGNSSFSLSPRSEKASSRKSTPTSRLVPSPRSSKAGEGVAAALAPEDDLFEELAGEHVLGDDASGVLGGGGGSSGSGGGGSPAVEKVGAAVPAGVERFRGVHSESNGARVATKREILSNASADAGTPTLPAVGAAPAPAPAPAPVAATTAKSEPRSGMASSAMPQPPGATSVFQEGGAPVSLAAQEPSAFGGNAVQVKRASGKKRPRPIKTGAAVAAAAAANSLPTTTATPGAGPARPVTPNGKRSPAKGGGKDKNRARGGVERKGGGTVRPQGQSSSGNSPAAPARRTQRAAAVVAAGKIKST
ncbi:unnamed protein product, partial [Scytosiphon promiscuus]